MLSPNHNPLQVSDGGNWPDSPSPSPSPCTTPSRPLLANHSHSSLSHNSRIQAIVRGQKELMEMVKNMPESSYELSLKDLVENEAAAPVPPSPSPSPSPPQGSKMRGGKGKREGKQKWVFLKMGLPICVHSNGKGGSIGERDWWKKKFSGSGDSDSSRESNSSGSTRSSSSGSSSYGGSGRKKKGFLGSCFPFLQPRSKQS